MFFLLNCIMKLVFVVIDSCGIVVKLLWAYCENPVGGSERVSKFGELLRSVTSMSPPEGKLDPDRVLGCHLKPFRGPTRSR